MRLMILSSIIRIQVAVILGGFLFFSCASNKAEKTEAVPLWADEQTLSLIFPAEEYIARTGTGYNGESARAKADMEISSYFNAQIKMHIQAEENFQNTAYDDYSKTQANRRLNRNLELISEVELPQLNHTEEYYDSKRKCYVVCSYINRNKACNQIKPRLESVCGRIKNAKNNAEEAQEIFQKIALLKSIDLFSEEFYRLYFQSLILLSEKADVYRPIDLIIQKAESERQMLKMKCPVSIVSSGDKTKRIETKVSEIFSKNGFSIGTENCLYTAKITADTTVTETNAIFISFPQVKVLMTKNDGTTVASYAKQFSKVSAYTADSCGRMALGRIEAELEKSFIRELFTLELSR